MARMQPARRYPWSRCRMKISRRSSPGRWFSSRHCFNISRSTACPQRSYLGALNRSETEVVSLLVPALLQGISSKQLAHSAHRACPPAGTTRIAAIDSFAFPQRRQIKSSPSQRASNPNSAIAAGSSINSTRTKLGSVSKAFPVNSRITRSQALRFLLRRPRSAISDRAPLSRHLFIGGRHSIQMRIS